MGIVSASGRQIEGAPVSRRSGAGVAITAEAEAKIAAYAKGDAGWAADLMDAALAIAAQRDLPAVDVAVVKAGLLQIWLTQQRLPPCRAAPAESTAAPPVVVAPANRSRPIIVGDDERAQSPRLRWGRAWSAINVLPAWLSGGNWNDLRLVVAALALIVAGWMLPRFGSPQATAPVVATPGTFDIARTAGAPVPSPVPPPGRSHLTAGAGSADAPVQAPPPKVVAPESAPPAVGPPSPARPEPPTESVREAQRLLARLGYRPGSTDGVAGPATVAAVQAFQRDARLSADGRIAPPLLKALRKRAQAAPESESAVGTPPQETKQVVEAPARRAPTPPADWLGSIARGIGRTYDSRARPHELAAHCRAVPDDNIYDQAAGRMVSCARLAGSAAPVARHTP